MNICFVISSYTVTGVPLAQIRLARALKMIGHSIDFVFGRDEPQAPFPPLPGMNVIRLDRKNARSMLWPLVKYLRSHRPDIIFSAQDNLIGIVLLAAILANSKAKISGSSRVPPSWTYSNTPMSKGWIFKQLLRAVMWRADALTCVSKDMADQYRQYFADPPHVAVYNIIDDKLSRERSLEPVEHPWFVDKQTALVVAAGTLSPRKGFADLIHAMKMLVDRGRGARLVIFGEGVAREGLEALVEELQLTDWVSLPGRVSNPLRYFAGADVFVLSSYAEGLPNVLVEAMMCGCSPVATDCPTGPREVLTDPKYGALVPMHDPAAIADGIERMLDFPISQDNLTEAVRPFETGNVIARHFEVLGI